jgi:peptidyl-prolyl cis-trans isomerase SurA
MNVWIKRVGTMRKGVLFFALPAAGFVFLLAGCAASGSQELLGKIGGEPLTLQEYEDSYVKHNGGAAKAESSSMDDREKFLDLLVKFKLKLREAYNKGLLADTSVQNELATYRLSVATSYMLEKDLVEPHVKAMYERMKVETRASHILIRVAPNASPSDTLRAYEKAVKIIAMIPTVPFDSLALRYSEDPGVQENKGDLGLFTAGGMVPQFEDACYSLKVGDYTRVPVRTQFGYHIIKVTAREPNEGSVRVSHILRRFKPDHSDSTEVADSTWIIYRLLEQGMDFKAAARRFSQDPRSSRFGGEIGSYDRGSAPTAIEQLFFSTPVDSVAKPLRAPYGYHIFKITSRSGLPSFQQAQKDLRQRYQARQYKTDYQEYVSNLKKEYHFNVDGQVRDQLAHSFDSTATPERSGWSDTLSSEFKDRVLFTYADRKFTVGDFIEHVNSTTEFNSILLAPHNVDFMVDRTGEAKVLEEHARHVEEQHPEFAKLMKEYQDGILLYRIEQDEIWKKIVVNDSLLHIFYDKNKEKYRWPRRVNFAEIYVTSDSAAQRAYKEIQAGRDFEDVAAEYTMRPGYKEKKGVWGFQPDTLNIWTKFAAALPVDSVSAPFRHVTGWSIEKVLAKDSARVKTFEEAKPEVASAYQEYAYKAREEQWLAALETKYPVVLNKKLLVKAFERKRVATD